MTVFERYKEARKELKITQTAIANAIGITQGALSQQEIAGNINIEALEFIRKTYNLNLNWLFDGKGDMIKDTKQSSEVMATELNKGEGSIHDVNSFMIEVVNENRKLNNEIKEFLKDEIQRVKEINEMRIKMKELENELNQKKKSN